MGEGGQAVRGHVQKCTGLRGTEAQLQGRHLCPRSGGWKMKQPLSCSSGLLPPTSLAKPHGKPEGSPAGQPPWGHRATGEEGSRPSGAKVNGRGLGSAPCLGPGTLLEDISAPKRMAPESTVCIRAAVSGTPPPAQSPSWGGG